MKLDVFGTTESYNLSLFLNILTLLRKVRFGAPLSMLHFQVKILHDNKFNVPSYFTDILI